MNAAAEQPLLYSKFAEWWPLLSDPEDYREEAGIFRDAILSTCSFQPKTMLELGSGGGNNASHLKRDFAMTLVDLSAGMLEVSRALNPECAHIQGDMRELRLRREFDSVFIHDAITYMVTPCQLRQAVLTAFLHCRPGGVTLFVPDWTVEHFRPTTSHGGHDRGCTGLRYLEWSVDPDPDDHRYTVYMVYLMRNGDTVTQSPLDRHECGLFSEQEWLETLVGVGFEPKRLPFDHSELEPGAHSLFMGIKPAR